jgi:hypothetical protein
MERRAAWVVVLGVAVMVLGACGRVDDSPGYEAYAAYRQVKTQEIPGTWGTRLEPLPANYDPKLSPSEVLDRFAGDTPRGAIVLDLAQYHEGLSYVVDRTVIPAKDAPAWVFLTRGVCFNSEKGALVASARRPDSYNPQRCSLANISILAIDADTGKLLATARGYDDTLDWKVARNGNPANPGAGDAVVKVSGTPVIKGSPVAAP